jgi:hypothetical protein
MKLILREKVGYITAIFRIAIYGLYVKEEIISLASEWQNVTKQRVTNTNPSPNSNSNHNPNPYPNPNLTLLQICF